MDVATHLLVPYAAALAALGFWRRGELGDRRRAAVAAVFGVSGAAPDLDGLVDGLSSRFDALYWLQHRGVSHTAWGAPLFALALLLVLAWMARAWPRRMSLFAWRPALVPAAVLGSWTHLVLDGITYGGVPLLWPLSFHRFGFMLFHWLVFWLFPVGALLLGIHAAGRLSRRRVAQGGVLVVALLVVVAGVRVATRPEAREGELIFPRPSDVTWMSVSREGEDGWIVGERGRDGGLHDAMVFRGGVPDAALDAVHAAQRHAAYRGFLMGSFGPRVTMASPLGDGGWNVTFVDVVQRYDALHEPRWTPTEPFEDWGYVSFHVRGADVDVVHRGW